MRLKLVRTVKIISIILVFLFGLAHVYVKDYILLYLKLKPKTKFTEHNSKSQLADHTAANNMKYILIWTEPRNLPLIYMGEGQKGFIDQKCEYTNCYVTGNRSLHSDLSSFDALVFNGPEIFFYQKKELPMKRSPHQLYVFTSLEPAYEYPICAGKYNHFFNWTWTYRLDSDLKIGPVVVRDREQRVIGPNVEMHWIKQEDMEPVSDDLKDQLMSKTRAVTWVVSHCDTMSLREDFARALADVLNTRYDLDLTVYGKCSGHHCPDKKACAKMIKEKYYFYLAFEKAFSEDYVTEEILLALQNYAVPVVYGSANYTRFMPDGSYLNAKELGLEKLAEKISGMIENPQEYHEFFRWRNHYSFHYRRDSLESNDYCKFCAMLNDENLMAKTNVYENFEKWWSPPSRCNDTDVLKILKIIG